MGGSAGEVLWVALKLGLTSFGGPIAHLGYFERTYVRQRRWLSVEQYGGLISLCQLLPGPTSSQVGFLIGLHRAGWLGALAAWVGFTLPSALLMYAFALFAPAKPGPLMQAVLHGLMLTAVVVVAQAVWSMSRSLAPDLPRRMIAVAACVPLLCFHSGLAQFLTLIGGAIAGVFLCRSTSRTAPKLPAGLHARVAWTALGVFIALLAGLSSSPLFQTQGPVALANIFYRSGAFVFGGGHVVLPLLQQALVPAGWLSDERFLAGYGFAQAMPGPLFTLAAYLGAASAPSHESLLWAAIALVAIFLPGLLLATSGLSLLGRISDKNTANAVLAGVNAAVVGLLAAALYNPVWVSAVRSAVDIAIVVVAFVLLQRLRTPPILIAALCVGASLAGS
ncbi:MAG: chromate efflux transporter [Proteobacteria bacterium]|nr:chromate efflux transporter [Pseudomonadota bacterium]